MNLEELKKEHRDSDIEEVYAITKKIAHELLGKNVLHNKTRTGMVVGYWKQALLIGHYKEKTSAWSIECFVPEEDGVLLVSSPVIRYLEYILIENIDKVL